MLIEKKDSPLPIFDTALLHASAGVDFGLADLETRLSDGQGDQDDVETEPREPDVRPVTKA
jgi:hypothetical protein